METQTTVSWFREFVCSDASRKLLPWIRGALLSPLPDGGWTFYEAHAPLVARWKQSGKSAWQLSRTDAYFDGRWPDKIWLVHEHNTLYWISKLDPNPHYVCMEPDMDALAPPHSPSDMKLTFYARSKTQRKLGTMPLSKRRFVVLEVDPNVDNNRTTGPFDDREIPGMVSYDRIKPGSVVVVHRGRWGRWLITSFKRSLRLWDLRGERFLLGPGADREVPAHKINQAHRSGVGTILALRRPATIVTTGKSENEVCLWKVEEADVPTLRLVEQFTFPGSGAVTAKHFRQADVIRLTRESNSTSYSLYFDRTNLNYAFAKTSERTSPPDTPETLRGLSRAEYALQLMDDGMELEDVRKILSPLDPHR